jgi:hypothetical protein
VRRTPRSPSAAAILGVGAVSLGAVWLVGCSADSELDGDKLVAALPAAVLEDHPDLLDNVVCPDGIEPATGTTTVCFADLAGDPVELTVTQLDDEGTVRVEVDRTLLDVEDLSTRIAERLTDDVGVATSVVCEGPAVRVLEVGDEVPCDATDPDDRTRTFVATILDADANYELRLD